MELNGKYFGKIGVKGNSYAMLIELENGLDVRKNSIGLIMPIMLVSGEFDNTIGNIDFDTNVAMYYDLDTNTIISDKVKYPIDESIGFVPIKGVLNPQRIQVEEQALKVNNNSLGLIESRIKGLRIALKVAKAENKPTIEKRIKGLEIAKKMQKDDLPFKNGGSVKKRILVVLDEGNGKVINDLFNEWYSVKNEKEYNVWAEKIKNTNFGTYGTTNINDVLEKFEFDKSKVNEVTKKDFKKEINNVRNK
jgi:hypothetical protein